jgi:hypothetical protein
MYLYDFCNRKGFLPSWFLLYGRVCFDVFDKKKLGTCFFEGGGIVTVVTHICESLYVEKLRAAASVPLARATCI